MGEFQLSRKARADLIEIYLFSDANFGRYQADAYQAGLERTFGLLADFPKIGSNADEISNGLRRFRFQSHFIFYSEEVGHVLIRTILHVRQNLRPALFE